MKIAVISDIHANLPALEAVLADARHRRADQFLCLGDIVGYGPHPQACVQKLRELKVPTVRGNHDVWATRRIDLARIEVSPTVNPGIDHARRELSSDAKRWLRALPLILETAAGTAAHASLLEPEAWNYIDAPAAAQASFARLNSRVGFFGHTHHPGFWRQQDLRWLEPRIGQAIVLSPTTRYLINPGSVGNPRTPAHRPDPRAQYLLVDRDALKATFLRVAYDVQTCVAAMREAGLPEETMSRIALGY